MALALKTWKADGTLVVSPQNRGGVFAARITRTQGAGALYASFPLLVGRSLRVFQVYAGSFAWSTGNDAGGVPYISLSPLPDTYNGSETHLLVFAL